MALECELGLRPSQQDILNCLFNKDDVLKTLKIPVSNKYYHNTCKHLYQSASKLTSYSCRDPCNILLRTSVDDTFLTCRVEGTKVIAAFMQLQPRSKPPIE